MRAVGPGISGSDELALCDLPQIVSDSEDNPKREMSRTMYNFLTIIVVIAAAVVLWFWLHLGSDDSSHPEPCQQDPTGQVICN